MPLTANHENYDDPISILDFDQPKQEIEVDGLSCPKCGSDLFIRSSTQRLDHFCHYPGSNDCGGETLEHLLGKNEIAKTILDQYSGEVDVEVERPIGDRIADVAVKHKGGQVVVHELQMSRITKDEVYERSFDYFEMGVSVCWWFGPKVPAKVRKWTARTFGGVVEVDVSLNHSNGHESYH